MDDNELDDILPDTEDTPETPVEDPDIPEDEPEPTEPEEPQIPIEDSILLSVKKLLGIMPEYEHFDVDITMHINSVFMILNQLGVGPQKCYRIKDKTNLWEEFIGDALDLESVKTYIFYKVKLLFDPPTNAAAVGSFERIIAELEWRLNFAAECKLTEPEEVVEDEDTDDDHDDEEEPTDTTEDNEDPEENVDTSIDNPEENENENTNNDDSNSGDTGKSEDDDEDSIKDSEENSDEEEIVDGTE